MIRKIEILVVLLIISLISFSQIFEAEDATLSGGASKQSNASVSGGYYVAQGEGNLTFNISVENEGSYNVYIQVASPAGFKSNIMAIDGLSITFNTDQNSSYVKLKVASYVKLAKGEHVIEIIKSWGWISIDYIEFEKVDPSTRFNINKTLVTPNPMDETFRLYQFLYDNYNSKIISGVSNVEEAEWLNENTGKSPALVGLDYLFIDRNYSWYDDNKPFNQGKAWAEKNGIVNFHWHWRDPSRRTEEFYTDKTNFDIRSIFDESSDDYQAMMDDIDFISTELNRFQELGIPVIWRPLHEAAGGWFWWGANGPEACKELWQVMFDRMVNVNNIHNLIWVWTHEPGDDEWYPGDDYVDIVGRDIYREGDHTSQVLEFNEMTSLYGGKKMVTISESGSFPDVDNLIEDEAGWSWFMPWNGDFTRDSKYNSIELWQKNLDSDYVITLDEMPEISSYSSTSFTGFKLDEINKSLQVFPSVFKDNISIQTTELNATISIYNANGILIKRFIADNCTTIVSMVKYPNGLYLVKAEGMQVVKLIKE